MRFLLVITQTVLDSTRTAVFILRYATYNGSVAK